MNKSSLSILFLVTIISSFGLQLKGMESSAVDSLSAKDIVFFTIETIRTPGVGQGICMGPKSITQKEAASLFKEWGQKPYKVFPKKEDLQTTRTLFARDATGTIDYSELQTILANLCK